MWRLVLSVVLWHTISSQPVTDDLQISRHQLDYVECCPCPGSSKSGLQDLRVAASDGFLRAAVDDCPCRLQDPEGSSSDFLPRAVCPVRPLIKPETSKDEIKPLLKPEVGLASSMLETLREVTDEEYQEALARDAARNAARVAELGDAQPETAKNVVTIIVNPRDNNVRDAIPQASQASETRCLHPSGSQGEVREAKKPSVLNLGQNFRSSLLDMDIGASEVKESVVGLNKGLDGLRLKTTPSLLSLFPPRKSEGNIQSFLKLKNNKQSKDRDAATNLKSSKPELPKRKLGSIFRKVGEEESPIKPLNPLGLGLTKLKIPKLTTTLTRKPKVDQFKNDDNSPSPSIVQQQLSVPTGNKNTLPFSVRSLFPQGPLSLDNILNLKDVELISPKSTKITLPDLNLFPPLRKNKPETKFVKQRKTKKCNTSAKENVEERAISNNQRIHTEILDAIPHASEMNTVIAFNNIEATTSTESNTNIIPKQDNIKTDILDALPSASESNAFLNDGSRFETSTPRLEDEVTDSDGDLVTQHFEETATEPTNKFLKDNVENVDTNENGIEFSIDNDGNTQFQEFEVVQETGQPISEIDISDSAIDSEGLNLEIDEDDLSEISFSSDDGEPIIMEESNEGEFKTEPAQEASEVGETEFNPEIEFNPDQNTENFERFETEEDFLSRQDSIAETSNQNIQLDSIEELPEERTNEPTDSLNSAESKLQNIKPSHKNDLLSSLKERISIKLNSFKNPETKVITISRFSEPVSEKSSFNSGESSGLDPLTEDTEKFIVDEKSAEMFTSATNQIGMQDLQQMSDSLLNESEKKITPESGNSEGKASSSPVKKNISLSKENNTEEIISNMDSSATSPKETLDLNEPNQDNFSVNDKNMLHNEDINARIGVGNAKSNNENSFDNACPSNLQLTESDEDMNIEKSPLNLRNNDEAEMESGASETVFNTARMPSSPLLHQSIVVQPASLFPPIPSLDLGNVNLPTLDEIRDRVSDILGGNARASEDETMNNDSDECPDDINPIMSSDASTTNMKSAFPTFRPLEDINLDIFQINPHPLGSPLSKIPSLNLNSFRTKLALPKSLELKPMKLQSSLGGKNGGLLGASLTFGPTPKLESILNLQGSDALRSPLSNLPSLDEIRERMRANAGSLLKSPIVSPLEDTLKTTEALSNSLRSHTENTMRNLQQSLSSTLNEARVTNTGDKFAKPQDLLERVSLAHEDVKDKLYGIHVDLQDRLSSLHDSILDKTNLPPIPTIQTPLFSGLGRLQESPFDIFRANNDYKRTPEPKLIIKKRKPTTKSNKPVSKPKEQNKVRPFKLSKAASSLTPKSIEVPKLMATSIKPPFLRPLQRDENVKLKETKSLFANDERKMIDKKKIKPFAAQSKVTIGTNPRPASFRTNPKSASTQKEKSARLSTQRMGQFKSFSDTRGFASEPQATKVPGPFKPVSTAESLEGNRQSLQTRPSSPPSKITDFALRNPLFPRKTPTLKSIAPIKLPSLKPSSAPLTLPKPTDSPIVSKMRDAIRIRLSRPVQPTNKLKNDAVSKPHGKEMIASSASESKAVAVKAEPMKENISYKCKMVCVRE